MDKDIVSLINIIAKLPGLGPKSSRRLVLHLLQNKSQFMLPVLHLLSTLDGTIKTCTSCGNLDKYSLCAICEDENRDATTLCVVEEVIDLWALERGNIYSGLYHVLGGTLSAIDGKGPEQLNIESLKDKIVEKNIKEVILAVGTTLDGQTTVNYISKFIRGFSQVKISLLAHGIPMGGEIDYLDDGTLTIALNSRKEYR